MFLDTVLNIINTMCELIMTIAAIVAIVITLKQIQNKKKSGLKKSYT